MISVLILAAGEGKRMGPGITKVLRPLHNKPMLMRIVDNCRNISNLKDIFIVASERNYKDISDAVSECIIIKQGLQKGTAKAVEAWADYRSDNESVLILSGDTPLLTTRMLQRFLDASSHYDAAITIFTPSDPQQYGRIIRGPDGVVLIKEFKDCTLEERTVGECNAGIYILSRGLFQKYIGKITNENAQEEYYLPDLFNHMSWDHLPVFLHHVDDEDKYRLDGVNTLNDLALMESYFDVRIEKLQRSDVVLGAYERLLAGMNNSCALHDTHVLHDTYQRELYADWYEHNSVTTFIIRHPFIKERLIGALTVWMDIKSFHDYRPAVHIEDLIIDAEWRGEGFSQKLVDHAIRFAASYNAYKVILDCADTMVHFYERYGFHSHGVQMSLYLL